MKYLLFILTFSLIFTSSIVFAQNNISHLPTMYSWDLSTNFPIGWYNYGLGSYSTGNFNPNSGKFDNTNDSLVIKFDSMAAVVSYFLKGNSLSSPCLFDVLESPDGVNYTKLASHQLIDTDTSFQITTKYQQFVFYPLHTTRVVKFVYSLKTAGNIAIDDIIIDNSLTSSVSLDKTENLLKIFPNPTNHSLYIRNNTDQQSIIIFDITGKLMNTVTIKPYELNEIDISNYPIGKYCFSFTSNKKINSNYFIKL